MPERDADQPDVNPGLLATDPLLSEIADMVSYMDLHIGRYEMTQLTARQKELWSDLVDSSEVLLARDDDSMDPQRRTVRWWRDLPLRPIGEEGFKHGEQAICRGCGKTVEWDADIERFWIRYEYGNPPVYTFTCQVSGGQHLATPEGQDEPDPFLYVDEGGTRHRQTG